MIHRNRLREQYADDVSPRGSRTRIARTRLVRMRRFAVLVCVASLTTAGCSGPPAPHVPHDAALRELPLYFYPPADSTISPRAFVFFFGNDVGFWDPHRKLAAALADDGFAVTGFDMRAMLDALPDSEPARDSIFGARIALIIAASRLELQADSAPLVLGGHSLGAEVALWTGAHVPVPRLAGVLAMSPGSRSHLRVTLSDLANGAEPDDAESFAVADAVRALPSGARAAIIRGKNDKYRFADSALVAAGGPRASRYVVPFAGHSLKRMIIAMPIVRRALDWILEPRRTAARQGVCTVARRDRRYGTAPASTQSRVSGAPIMAYRSVVVLFRTTARSRSRNTDDARSAVTEEPGSPRRIGLSSARSGAE